jgi:hypothetical protein
LLVFLLFSFLPSFLPSFLRSVTPFSYFSPSKAVLIDLTGLSLQPYVVT